MTKIHLSQYKRQFAPTEQRKQQLLNNNHIFILIFQNFPLVLQAKRIEMTHGVTVLAMCEIQNMNMKNIRHLHVNPTRGTHADFSNINLQPSHRKQAICSTKPGTYITFCHIAKCKSLPISQQKRALREQQAIKYGLGGVNDTSDVKNSVSADFHHSVLTSSWTKSHSLPSLV